MSSFDQSSQREERTVHLPGLLEEPQQIIPQGNLARGIVWADILADIAADEEARRRTRDLPEAA